MYNVFDYLYWRGDLTFDKVPFNEIDNLIMSRISYFPLENIIDNEITIKEAYEKVLLGISNNNYLNNLDDNLFRELSRSLRYKDLILSNFINDIDYNKEQQFGAITIKLPNNTVYVSFRGTDNTIIGFKEDLNMSFLDELPSQKNAVNYLNNLINTNYNIIVGGHSKGGNLAIYGSLYCDLEIQDRIIGIYNNDGPGFLKELINSEEYNRIKKRIHTFIPGSSIVGRLLNVCEEYTIVKSDNKFILQHDLYSWEIEKDKLITLEDLNKDSKYIEKIVDDWLNNLDIEDRKIFVDTIYNVVAGTNAITLNDLYKNVFVTLKNIKSTYKNINQKNKQIVEKTLKFLLLSIKNILLNKK